MTLNDLSPDLWPGVTDAARHYGRTDAEIIAIAARHYPLDSLDASVSMFLECVGDVEALD
jgi:hypothetical protein